ncbi:MAG: twin-arginine translocation signal domain-containing protein, partial [Planctomycetota bacterium]
MSEPRPPAPEGTSRRSLLARAAAAGAGLGLLAHAVAWGKSLVPRVLYEPPSERRLGPPDRFPEGLTYLKDAQVFVIRTGNVLRALS